jgi:hypothetical protein
MTTITREPDPPGPDEIYYWMYGSWRRALDYWQCCSGNKPCYWHRCSAETRKRGRCHRVSDRRYQWEYAWFCAMHGERLSAGKPQTTMFVVPERSPQMSRALDAMSPGNESLLFSLIDSLLVNARIDSDTCIYSVALNCTTTEGLNISYQACSRHDEIHKFVKMAGADVWAEQEDDLSSILDTEGD